MRITSMKTGERFDTSFYIAFWFQLIVEIFGIMHNFSDKSCFEIGETQILMINFCCI